MSDQYTPGSSERPEDAQQPEYTPYNNPPQPPYGEGQQPPQNPYQQPYQQTYQPAPYQPPYYGMQPPVQPAKSLGITGFVLSLLGLLCFLFPPLSFIGLSCSIVARAKGNKSGLVIAGIVLGILGILVALYFVFAFAVARNLPDFWDGLMDSYYYNF